MRKVFGINGSPRKNWNTAAMLRRALDGAETAGAATDMVHLYDLNFKGCGSCFVCKRKSSFKDGRCGLRDDLSPILEQAMECDVLLMASPIYLSDVTGVMRSFWERLIFMNLAYDANARSVCAKSISCGLIYTMNIQPNMVNQWGYAAMFESHVSIFKILNGAVEYVTACDTYQFDDYSRYHAPMFDAAHKKLVRDKIFPVDCEKAYRMGERLVEGLGPEAPEETEAS
jgi:multimeric flavodoxin WrbA